MGEGGDWLLLAPYFLGGLLLVCLLATGYMLLQAARRTRWIQREAQRRYGIALPWNAADALERMGGGFTLRLGSGDYLTYRAAPRSLTLIEGKPLAVGPTIVHRPRRLQIGVRGAAGLGVGLVLLGATLGGAVWHRRTVRGDRTQREATTHRAIARLSVRLQQTTEDSRQYVAHSAERAITRGRRQARR